MGKTCNRPWLHYQTNRVEADIFDLGACASYCGRLDADAVHMHDAVGWWSGTCSDGSVARLKMVNDGSRCMGRQAGFRDVHWKRFCGLQPMGKEVKARRHGACRLEPTTNTPRICGRHGCVTHPSSTYVVLRTLHHVGQPPSITIHLPVPGCLLNRTARVPVLDFDSASMAARTGAITPYHVSRDGVFRITPARWAVYSVRSSHTIYIVSSTWLICQHRVALNHVRTSFNTQSTTHLRVRRTLPVLQRGFVPCSVSVDNGRRVTCHGGVSRPRRTGLSAGNAAGGSQAGVGHLHLAAARPHQQVRHGVSVRAEMVPVPAARHDEDSCPCEYDCTRSPPSCRGRRQRQ